MMDVLLISIILNAILLIIILAQRETINDMAGELDLRRDNMSMPKLEEAQDELIRFLYMLLGKSVFERTHLYKELKKLENKVNKLKPKRP